MADSSIGKQVVLDYQSAKRLGEIMKKPSVPVSSMYEPMELCNDMEKFSFLRSEKKEMGSHGNFKHW